MEHHNCYVVLFDSTHQALRAEAVLKEAGIPHAVINTPREFSVDCGISLRIDTASEKAAGRALREAGVVFTGIVPYTMRKRK
jgi:hypothetical protein